MHVGHWCVPLAWYTSPEKGVDVRDWVAGDELASTQFSQCTEGSLKLDHQPPVLDQQTVLDAEVRMDSMLYEATVSFLIVGCDQRAKRKLRCAGAEI
jgi:hypothetical protein